MTDGNRWAAFTDAEVEVIAMGMTMHEYQASDDQIDVFDALAEEALAECKRRGIPDPTRDVDADGEAR